MKREGLERMFSMLASAETGISFGRKAPIHMAKKCFYSFIEFCNKRALSPIKTGLLPKSCFAESNRVIRRIASVAAICAASKKRRMQRYRVAVLRWLKSVICRRSRWVKAFGQLRVVRHKPFIVETKRWAGVAGVERAASAHRWAAKRNRHWIATTRSARGARSTELVFSC